MLNTQCQQIPNGIMNDVVEYYELQFSGLGAAYKEESKSVCFFKVLPVLSASDYPGCIYRNTSKLDLLL